MCLSILYSVKTRRPDLKLNRDKHGWFGWKIYSDHYKNHLRTMNYGKDQRVGEWLNSNLHYFSKSIYTYYAKRYPSGFHVYLKRPKYKPVGKESIRKVSSIASKALFQIDRDFDYN